ncbi:NAD(P)-binding protein [Artomyces pyxidatus]|uniref:NAD(P)-binding protein n=1 Tax=Artomyces pyxidatus TaxID=48021 RepID=A0ACB8SZ13_9AGAM|nr:NAD(P)-binding protein [Artomyces pyxidatus]
MHTNNLPPARPIGRACEVFPPKPTWTADQVPDMVGKVVIVTGGNNGLGKEMCRVLLKRNAKVYMAARSETKALAAIEELQGLTGRSAIFLRLDLADLHSVRHAAEEFINKEQQLDVLFNNGGVMFSPTEMMTAQGYDLQFGTNVLGHFFFTNLLIPVLLRTARGEVTGTPCNVRVVNLASMAHVLYPIPEGIRWETLVKGEDATPSRKKMGPQSLYGQSKLGNILFSNELARRYGDQGIVSIALHPGMIRTDLMRHLPSAMAKIINMFIFDVTMGVITPLYAGTAEEAEEMNGEYLTVWARRQVPRKVATDPDLMERMWAYCEEQVKGF